MANNGNQKIKILKIMEMFLHETDEEHHLNAADIIERLKKDDITAERKSIYSDIQILQDFGMDIIRSEEQNSGFYLASREFELSELKLLADAVSASKFITEKKSKALVDKIGTLASDNEAKQLHRQVVVTDRAKAVNEAVLYSIDVIYRCIDNNHKLSFQYEDYDLDKKKVLRHDGKRYSVSPAFLIWDNLNYYLVAYSDGDQAIRHYRVDKLVGTMELDEKRSGMDEIRKLKESDYARRNFSMFAGQETSVHIRFPKKQVGIMIDRFGKDVTLHPDGDDYAVAIVTVDISNQFFGWLTGLGPAFTIQSPAAVVDEYKNYMKKILEAYQE